jgi:hypothetical protein
VKKDQLQSKCGHYKVISSTFKHCIIMLVTVHVSVSLDFVISRTHVFIITNSPTKAPPSPAQCAKNFQTNKAIPAPLNAVTMRCVSTISVV